MVERPTNPEASASYLERQMRLACQNVRE
jgi:hypothetical protein